MSCPHAKIIRPELEPLPSRMQMLPVDERGYVIPWFVDWVDGKPEFRAMDPKKFVRAIKEKLCWTCGQRMGRFMTFVAGPMCGINRTSSEPPNHFECAEWSARNCPFLSNSKAVRRVDEKLGGDMSNAAGFVLTRNPGVTMLWTCLDYSVFDDGKGKPLLHMGDPAHVEWYAEGRPATREQVDESIASGLPALVTIASQQDGAMKFLNESCQRFERYLPQ
jgi:hypothetical protein